MNRSYRSNPASTAAVRDRSSQPQADADDSIQLSIAELILAIPCRSLGGMRENDPMDDYRRMLQLVDTPALLPCDVLRGGARALQKYFTFES
jgi:hypothetical protein